MSSSLDPSLKEHLQLKAFESKFNVTDFVGSVSEKLITQSKADPGPFDPSPFIQTFEAAVDKLIAVRKDVQAKTEQMEKSVRIAEREYSKKMADLNRGFETVGNSFAGMETKMNEVSSTAIRMGEQLESVHIERQRAQAAYDLIDYYNQFSREDTTRLDALKKEGRDGRRAVAVVLRRLVTVAKEVDLPSAEKTRDFIDKYCEKFEKDMLYLFDRCYRKGEPKMMHHCAQTLLEFNGGTSCVQVYVNQHDFFMKRVRDDGDTPPSQLDEDLWEALPNPGESPPREESSLSALFAEIRLTVDQEAQIVKAVFPNPPVVMQVFLQRVFAQSIQEKMETLLNRGQSISDLAYLRVLQLVHIQTAALVDDLKAYELPSSSPRSPAEATEFRRSMTGAMAPSSNPGSAMSTMLETAMDELFGTYTENQRYLDRESRSLGALYSSLLVNFARYHAQTHKGKSSMFDRMVTQLSAAATTSTGTGPSTSAQAAMSLMRFGGFTTERAADTTGEIPIREEDGLLTVETAERMLKWHAEAVGRCVELSSPADVAKNTFALLRVLAEALGDGYVEDALETALARLEGSDGKTEPNLQPLSILKLVDLICHLWQQYVGIAILPLAGSSVTIRREMVVFNNQTVSRIEGSANTLMQRVTDLVVSWLALQLARQKKMDFRPRNDDLSFARVNTEPCVACCETLEKVREAAKQNLSGKNLEIFLTEVGVAFHSLLLEHLRKFPVNATGGLMLAKDLKSYQDTITSFGIPALHERFEFLRQLGNIFLVHPGVLKSYITENYLGRIDATLLKPYLAQRSDYGQYEKDIVQDDPASSGPAAKAFGMGMGRLSVMMKDMEKLGSGVTLGMPALPTGLGNSFMLARMGA